MRFSTLICTLCFSTMTQMSLSAGRNDWIEEIRQTELKFCEVSESKGIKAAFLEFAAEEAVLKRGEQLIRGKTEIAAFYDAWMSRLEGTVVLKWEPDFIDVSDDGNFGYTYGAYTFTQSDVDGKESVSEGIFHTIWKRQADGRWKYVWD